MSNDLEARLVHIVSLVLASTAAACSADGRVVHTTDTTGAGPAPTVSVAVTATPVSSFPPGDPRIACATYRDKIAPDPAGPKLRYVTDETRGDTFPGDVEAQPLDKGNVQCRIVWERTESSTTLMVAPTCCPQGMGDEPCPPASPQQFRLERSKVETVVLDEHGAVVSSSLAWNVWQDEPQQHNCGRRPEGFVPSRARATTREGACLAEMAELEAASIAAFGRLARELHALGAPPALVARARVARRDEIRHARVLRRLAAAYGAAPARLRQPGREFLYDEPRAQFRRPRRLDVRAPLEVAIENATEGCVFETFGAAVASFQAARAVDPSVRGAFAQIAVDERAHASLAWDVDAFLSAVLDEAGRTAVARARRGALAKLRASQCVADERTRTALGLPPSAEHRALATAVAAL